MRGLAFALSILLVTPVTPQLVAAPDRVASVESPTPRRDVRTARAVLDPTLEPARGRVSAATPFESGRAAFQIRVDGEPVPFGIHPVLVLPGETVLIESDTDAPVPAAALRHAAGTARSSGSGRWIWQAPDVPGIHALRVEAPGGPAVDLVAFVLHPRDRAASGVLGGYRIGAYRPDPLGGRDEYLPPEGFIEATPGEEDIRVSPHFTLGEFLCKQPGDPRYLTFTPALVTKLETVLEEANARGIRAGTFTVMSGFRTPWYNRSIGNTTDYSRHLWGDAADIYVDVDGDGDMDDLNGDGVRDLNDARVLADVVESVSARGLEEFVPGGLSVYRPNAAHGPFVHVDARGVKARW